MPPEPQAPFIPALIDLGSWALFGDRDFPEICEAARQVKTLLELRKEQGIADAGQVVNFDRFGGWASED